MHPLILLNELQILGYMPCVGMWSEVEISVVVVVVFVTASVFVDGVEDVVNTLPVGTSSGTSQAVLVCDAGSFSAVFEAASICKYKRNVVS